MTLTLHLLLSTRFWVFVGFYRGTNKCPVADKRSFALYFSVKRNIFIIKKTLKDRISLFKTPHDACLAPRSLVFESNSQLLIFQNDVTLPVMCDEIRVTIKDLFVFKKKFVHVLRIFDKDWAKHRKSLDKYFILQKDSLSENMG